MKNLTNYLFILTATLPLCAVAGDKPSNLPPSLERQNSKQILTGSNPESVLYSATHHRTHSTASTRSEDEEKHVEVSPTKTGRERSGSNVPPLSLGATASRPSSRSSTPTRRQVTPKEEREGNIEAAYKANRRLSFSSMLAAATEAINDASLADINKSTTEKIQQDTMLISQLQQALALKQQSMLQMIQQKIAQLQREATATKPPTHPKKNSPTGSQLGEETTKRTEQGVHPSNKKGYVRIKTTTPTQSGEAAQSGDAPVVAIPTLSLSDLSDHSSDGEKRSPQDDGTGSDAGSSSESENK